MRAACSRVLCVVFLYVQDELAAERGGDEGGKQTASSEVSQASDRGGATAECSGGVHDYSLLGCTYRVVLTTKLESEC